MRGEGVKGREEGMRGEGVKGREEGMRGEGVKGREEGMRGEGVKGREEGGGSGGKGVEEGAREWWGGSGDAGPSLPFVVGARRCLGWCWAAVAVRRWCVWALVAVRLWRASLPFVVGTRRCRFSLACAVAVCRWCASLPWVVLWWCRRPWGVVLLCGGSSCSVRDRYSWVGDRRRPWVGHCRLWMGVVVVRGGSLWSWMGHCCGPWALIVRVVGRC
jgi:hypothetical protein